MEGSAPWRTAAGAWGFVGVLVGAGPCGLVGAGVCGLVGGLTGTGVGEPSEPAALLHCLRQTSDHAAVSGMLPEPDVNACTRGHF